VCGEYNNGDIKTACNLTRQAASFDTSEGVAGEAYTAARDTPSFRGDDFPLGEVPGWRKAGDSRSRALSVSQSAKPSSTAIPRTSASGNAGCSSRDSIVIAKRAAHACFPNALHFSLRHVRSLTFRVCAHTPFPPGRNCV